jgi:hypothetical protein
MKFYSVSHEWQYSTVHNSTCKVIEKQTDKRSAEDSAMRTM